MKAWLCLLGLLSVLWGCGPPPETSSSVGTLPGARSEERNVRGQGARALSEAVVEKSPPFGPDLEDVGVTDFKEGAARSFLENNYYKPAVQFGCCRILHAFEDSVEKELLEGTDRGKLQALVLLMKAHAPASVALQWKALQQLRETGDGNGLLDGLEARFSEDTILRELEVAPPEDRYRHDSRLEWYVRAAGVTRCRPALPTLIRLSRSEHLDTSLAAERSLEEFEGEEGDQALVQCLLGWQYDAYIRSGRALLDRNRRLLVEKLQGTLVPEKCRHWQAIFLARADEPAAVPLLCETVTSVGIIDREMFDHIERLAREQDLPQVRLLAARAQGTQQERANRLVEDLSRKFSGR